MAVHLCAPNTKISWEKLKPYILGRMRCTDEFTCASCDKSFPTICTLHIHCIKHNKDGSYFFDTVTNTAHPKYESQCRFTQVESFDYDEEGAVYGVKTAIPREINLKEECNNGLLKNDSVDEDIKGSTTCGKNEQDIAINAASGANWDVNRNVGDDTVSVIVTNLSRQEDGTISFEMDSKDSHLFDAAAQAIQEQMQTAGPEWLTNTMPCMKLQIPNPCSADENPTGPGVGENPTDVSESHSNHSNCDGKDFISPEKHDRTSADGTVAESFAKWLTGHQVNGSSHETSNPLNKEPESDELKNLSISTDAPNNISVKKKFDESSGTDIVSPSVIQIEHERSCLLTKSDEILDKTDLQNTAVTAVANFDSVYIDNAYEINELAELDESFTEVQANTGRITRSGKKRKDDAEFKVFLDTTVVMNERPVRNRRMTMKFKESEIVADMNLFNRQTRNNNGELEKESNGHNTRKKKREEENTIKVKRCRKDKNISKTSSVLNRSESKVERRKGYKPVVVAQSEEAHKTASEALLSLSATSEESESNNDTETVDITPALKEETLDEHFDSTAISAEHGLIARTDKVDIEIKDGESNLVKLEDGTENSHNDSKKNYFPIEPDNDATNTGTANIYDETFITKAVKPVKKKTLPTPRAQSNSKSGNRTRASKRKDFKCPVCGKVGSAAMVQYHEQVHSGKLRYSCDICGKGFTNRPCLRQHLIRHGEKKWTCQYCPEAFFKKSYLDTHLRKHTGENPYLFVCDLCGEGFKERYILRRHINNFHKQIRNYQCDICQEKFFRADTRDSHRARHFDPFLTCSYCTKMFKGELDRRKHELTHTGDKQFFCPLCTQGFGQLWPYYRHMWKIHNVNKEKAKLMRVKNPEIVNMRNRNRPGKYEVNVNTKLSETGDVHLTVVTKQLRKVKKLHEEDGAEPEQLDLDVSDNVMFTEVDIEEMQQAVGGANEIIKYTEGDAPEGNTIVLNMPNNVDCPGETIVIQADEIDSDGRYVMYEGPQGGDQNIVILPEYTQGKDNILDV